MVRWLRWHCPPDTGSEIRALAVWGRARYLSVTEAPHNTRFHTWMGKKQYVSFKPPRPGTEPRTLAWKAAVLTTTLGPPPCSRTRWNIADSKKTLSIWLIYIRPRLDITVQRKIPCFRVSATFGLLLNDLGSSCLVPRDDRWQAAMRCI